MTVKNWVSCLDVNGAMHFSVWKDGWVLFDSVDDLVDKFGDAIVKKVSIDVSDIDLDVYVDIHIAD